MLLAQNRPKEAEAEARKALAIEPNVSIAHAVLARCLAHADRIEEAKLSIRRAIELDPNHPYPFYLLAIVLLDQKKWIDAQRAIDQAIKINPNDPDQWAVLGQIQLDLSEPQKALESAEQGLAVDAQDVGCTNVRALALVKLGRTAEAVQSTADAISREPENPISHTNQGWVLMHQGKPKQALVHFQEALRLDPGNEWAQAGLVEALQARYLPYRLLLGYFLWMSRLNPKAQTGLIIGAYILFRILYAVANNYPQFSAWIWPIVIIYLCFAGLTWVGVPLANLMIRLNKYGRHALNKQQRVTSTYFGLTLLAAALALGAAVYTGDDLLYALAFVLGVGLLAVPMLFHHWGGKRWYLALGLFGLMAAAAAGALVALALNAAEAFRITSGVAGLIFVGMMLYTSFAGPHDQ